MRGESTLREATGGADRPSSSRPGRGDTLDVVDSDDPVGAVLGALETLSGDGTLEVVSAVSPVPLYDRLDERGFDYRVVRTAPDRWRIRITPAATDAYCGERLRRPRRNRLR